MPGPFVNWPPFRLVALNADTGKPIDPNVGMRVQREFYDVKKDRNGKKVVVAHKSPSGSKIGGVAGAEDVKNIGKGGSGKDGGGGKGKGKGGGEAKNDGGDEKVSIELLRASCQRTLQG